jgi:hypothetical protein
VADGDEVVPVMPGPPPELTEPEFVRYYGPWSPLHPTALLRLFDGAPFTWWVVGGWSLETDPRQPRRRHEDIDVAVRADQVDDVRGWLRDFHLWQTYPGLRPVFPGEPLPAGLEQMWVRRDAWSPWLMDVLLTPVDGHEWVYKRDHRVRLPLADVVHRGPDGVPYQAPQVGLLFKAKQTRDKDEGDLADCWPRLGDEARRWLRESLDLTQPGHPWSARLTDPGEPEPPRESLT